MAAGPLRDPADPTPLRAAARQHPGAPAQPLAPDTASSWWDHPHNPGGYAWGQLTHVLAWVVRVAGVQPVQTHCVMGRRWAGAACFLPKGCPYMLTALSPLGFPIRSVMPVPFVYVITCIANTEQMNPCGRERGVQQMTADSAATGQARRRQPRVRVHTWPTDPSNTPLHLCAQLGGCT